MMNQVSHFVGDILAQTQATHYLGFLGGEGNFRHEVAVSRKYKGNRGPKPESIVLWEEPIKNFLVDHWGFVRCHGIEADDACSIAHGKYSQDYSLTTVGCDHDLQQLSGWHWNYQKGSLTKVTPHQAIYNFYHQLLTGCTGDCVPGCPRVGEVRATALLSDYPKYEDLDKYQFYLEDCVKAEYLVRVKEGDWEAYYEEQHTLLKLLDTEQYGFQCPQPIPVPQAQEPVLESIDHLFN
ncbi:hypothetical protein Q5H92_14920 [Hymenobacter sp. M29]|uniref:Uncharacterized protein n=1 Tax=Hymenobacter mellowenesis TaxID=3063995 RepID=A0ABT9ACX4_9BACT|nr:hypothetical protein [Hymenobacter sp. M29]MDO7847659.1 hypothetical protein [Hymenobacter sp. M29]